MKIGNSFNTQITNNINQNKTNTQEILSKIGSVKELSGKDNASLMISGSLNTQISSLTQEIQNSNNMVGMMQIADFAVSEMSKGSDKLNQLFIRNSNGILNSDQKEMLQKEFNATVDTMQSIVDSTSYNGKSLFSSEFNLEVNGLSELSIDNPESINAFTDELDVLNSQVSARTSEHEVSIANSLSAVSNLTNSYANISEEALDIKVSDLAANQIKLDASVLAQNHQNNVLQQRIATLLM